MGGALNRSVGMWWALTLWLTTVAAFAQHASEAKVDDVIV
jgi:hypothetical protein